MTPINRIYHWQHSRTGRKCLYLGWSETRQPQPLAWSSSPEQIAENITDQIHDDVVSQIHEPLTFLFHLRRAIFAAIEDERNLAKSYMEKIERWVAQYRERRP